MPRELERNADRMGWHVLHVKSRCEKKAAEHCDNLGLEQYLPLRRETKIYQRRRVTVEKPLFQGYVFAAFESARKTDLMRCHAILNVLEVVDEARLLRELDQVRMALAVDPTLGVERLITTGRRVRITSGPFMGLEGTVQTVKGATRVMLSVEMIGQAIAVQAETGLLEPAD